MALLLVRIDVIFNSFTQVPLAPLPSKASIRAAGVASRAIP
jgi:hypothetical protein